MKVRTAMLLAIAPILIAAMGRAPASSASALPTRIELFGRTMFFTLPPQMKLVTDKRNGTNVLIEFIPEGENLGTWTRMVTVQAYRGLGASPTPSAEIARRAFYPAACRIGPAYRDSGERVVGKGLKLSVLAIGCASLPAGAYPLALAGAGEQDFIMMFRDADTIYTVNYAERGARFVLGKPPRKPEDAAAILEEILGHVAL